MIVTDKFLSFEKKELQLGLEPNIFFLIVYKSKIGIRLFVSSYKRGDADIYLDNEEKELLVEQLRGAVSRSRIEQKGFCPPLISPQKGDEMNSIVNAVFQVVFFNKIIGIAIDVQGEHGVEAWLELNDVQRIIEAIN